MPETVSVLEARVARPTLAADIIIANAPDPVFVCDLEGKILEANEAVSQLLGLRRDEVLEQSISRFLGQNEAREFVVALREVVEHGVTRNVRLQPRSASGESWRSSGGSSYSGGSSSYSAPAPAPAPVAPAPAPPAPAPVTSSGGS